MDLKTTEELREWLAQDAPVDAASFYKVAREALHVFQRSEYNGGGSRESLAWEALRKNWITRVAHDLQDAAYDAIDRAKIEHKACMEKDEARRKATRLAESAKRGAERKRQAAAEERLKLEAERHTKRVKKLVSVLNVSTRQAQRLIREGTKDARRAEQMAEVLGGDATNYLQARAKPGRQPDLVAHMMRIRASGLDFGDFIRDDVALEGEAKMALWTLYEELDDLRDFETYYAAAAKRGIADDHVRRIWLEFVLWRIRAIADRAEQSVSERLDSVFDFG